MSTLSNTDLTVADANITTLKDGSGNNPSTPADILQGRAKAWVKLNGTGTIAVAASYNVTSISDLGTGNYRVTWATDFNSIEYCVSATAGDSSAANERMCSISEVHTVTTSACKVFDKAGSAIDDDPVMFIAFGAQ